MNMDLRAVDLPMNLAYFDLSGADLSGLNLSKKRLNIVFADWSQSK